MRNVTECQSCGSDKLRSVVHLGNLPLVNDYRKIGEPEREQATYPAELLSCSECSLVQLGCILPAEVLFPASYPYTSSTTRALRENFAELAAECRAMGLVKRGDFVIDIGGNDGNLLSNFSPEQRVLNVTPEDVGSIAVERGIETMQAYWADGIGETIRDVAGPAALVTATNVFAHVEDPHEFVEEVISVLAPGGVFVTESHYLGSLLANCEFDAVYHEHLRYYSLRSLTYLLKLHGLEVIHAKQISTHGGSIRVYAARIGERDKVSEVLIEPLACGEGELSSFATAVTSVKQRLNTKLNCVRAGVVHGVGAPSRAATLLAYCGIGRDSLPCVYETAGSHKVSHYMPGTRIPVEREPDDYSAVTADTLMLLSWHIGPELVEMLRAKGFRGQVLAPLPEPRFL